MMPQGNPQGNPEEDKMDAIYRGMCHLLGDPAFPNGQGMIARLEAALNNINDTMKAQQEEIETLKQTDIRQEERWGMIKWGAGAISGLVVSAFVTGIKALLGGK
ncbi:MAG: hypothetical protein JRD89_02955 [Deltaproteobacteria bacterium]|nr:hypothetical protein [Deltaproteobacteria bacterium]